MGQKPGDSDTLPGWQTIKSIIPGYVSISSHPRRGVELIE
jgi:hypothetical protein